MSTDPTLSEMKAALAGALPPSLRYEGWEQDCLIAAYYFAAHHYQGQGSNLYAAICEIDYNPKCLELEDEPSSVQECYEILRQDFAPDSKGM